MNKRLPLWRCPKCDEQIRTAGTEVAHRCTQNKNRMTNFERVKDEPVEIPH